MAVSFSDILTSLKNGVIAINSLTAKSSYAFLGQGALTTSYTTLYTVPSTNTVYVNDICAANTTSSALSIYVSLVPINATASAANALFYNVSIPAYSTLQWTGNQVINSGGSIQAYASATGCSITISGKIN